MNKIRFLAFILMIGTLILSACGAGAMTATPAPVSVSQKVEAMPVTFVGIVDSIAGDQWVISGTTVTIDASIVRDGPFTIGDRIKVEGLVNPDGSLTVSRVESPAPQETATQPPLVVDNSNEAIGNANTNDANVNDDNSNSVNSNDSNTNDDDGGNTNDDNSNDSNVNDDSSNTNDDNSNDSNTNDDNGGNDNGDDDGGNSNDDNGNDDNSGGGGGNDDSGDDDNGSGGHGSDD